VLSDHKPETFFFLPTTKELAKEGLNLEYRALCSSLPSMKFCLFVLFWVFWGVFLKSWRKKGQLRIHF